MQETKRRIGEVLDEISKEVKEETQKKRRRLQQEFRKEWKEIPDSWILEKSCVFWKDAEACDCFYSCPEEMISSLRSKGYQVSDEGHVFPKTPEEQYHRETELLDMQDQEKTMFESIKKHAHLGRLVNLCMDFRMTENDVHPGIRDQLLEYRDFFLDSSDIPWFYHVLAHYFIDSGLLKAIDYHRENYAIFLKRQENQLLYKIEEQLENRECSASEDMVELNLTIEYRGLTPIILGDWRIDVNTEEQKVAITKINEESED